MSSITLKQVGQVALTLGVSYGANKLIEKGFQAWNSKNAEKKGQENAGQVLTVPRIVPLGTIQKIAKAILTLGVGVFVANYSGLISLSNLASRFATKTPEAAVPAAAVAAKALDQQPVEVQAPVAPQADAQVETPVAPQADVQVEAPVAPQADAQVEAPVAPQADVQVEAPVVPQAETLDVKDSK